MKTSIITTNNELVPKQIEICSCREMNGTEKSIIKKIIGSIVLVIT